MNTKTRIGIYAGTFDPLHEGHLSFARAAVDRARLNRVYFLPEREPRLKPHASAYKARVERLTDVLDGTVLRILELPDHALTMQQTLPEIEQKFPGSYLTFLVGADVLQHMHAWPGIKQLCDSHELIVGVRTGFDHAKITQSLQKLGLAGERALIVHTDQAHISSTTIRSDLG